MTKPSNRIECIAFTADAFTMAVEQGTGAAHPPSNRQTYYLAQYLDSLGAKTLLIERHYIDRHFIEEVGLYYSKCLTPYPNSCVRIHAFARRFDDQVLDEYLQASISGDSATLQTELQPSYLGYVTVRPLASVPIGRTVLRHLDQSEGRRFPVAVMYNVHLLGTTLQVSGLAFQQQDRAVAACATTAIWSALQRVCRHDGGRAPTPSAVTQAAVRHFLPEGRAFPSTGLTIEQICEALRGFEFPPAIFRVGSSPDQFLFLLNVYVRSGVPVILALVGGDAGHAVTVVGYQSDHAKIPSTFNELDLRLVNLGYDKIYIHDDRLGPYARATFRRKKSPKERETPLDLVIDWPDGQEVLNVLLGVPPLYPKLRSSAQEILEGAALLLPVIQKLVPSGFEIEAFFQRSGEYLASMLDANVDPSRATRFMRSISLSRYVGVIRIHVKGSPVLDLILDTTDTIRRATYAEHLLGIIAFDTSLHGVTDWLATVLEAQAG